MFKRLFAAASVSVIALVGLAPAASAVPAQHKIVSSIDWDTSTRSIDWDAPTRTIQRSIDWD